MSGRRMIGLVLVIVGIVALAWGGISWTREKTVVDLGPIEATAEERETIPLPPVLGVISLVGGILLLVVPEKRRV
jgi:uncharacterized membrane protein HdeD (DUF308 family)